MGSINRTSSDSDTDETGHRLPWETDDDQGTIDEYDDSDEDAEEDNAPASSPNSTGGSGGGGGSAGAVSVGGGPTDDEEDRGLIEGIIDGILSPVRGETEIDDSGRGIPGSKLEAWSKPGPSTNTKETCDSIKRALRDDPELQERDIEFSVYIQGSYKNATNIHGNSDVDIVIQLDAPYRLEQRDGMLKIVAPDGTASDYDYEQFKRDVIDALRRRYGRRAVTVGDKAIEIHSSDSTLRIDADVVVSQRHRTPEGSGMWFETRHGKEITNYPKQHYQHGTAKNKRTNGQYKKTLRMFKRARSYLVKKGRISKDDVPSYFLECLLYNVPDEAYTASDPQANDYQRRFCNIVNYLNKNDISEFACQNEAHALFGQDSTQWNTRDAERFIKELVHLWGNWY